jgi:ABC-type glutathione transport system ATPase component
VFEALLFAARLRLPEWISEDEKKARVEGVMAKLGIAALRDVRIGYAGGGGGGGRARGISGGEMRRVSIGLELVAKPDVLILDEPTSGWLMVSWRLEMEWRILTFIKRRLGLCLCLESCPSSSRRRT